MRRLFAAYLRTSRFTMFPASMTRAGDCSRRATLALVAVLTALLSLACNGRNSTPKSGSQTYQEAVSLFHSAVARMELGEDRGAEYRLRQGALLAPGESAFWYNLGLLALRAGRTDSALVHLDRAMELSPDESRVLRLAAIASFRSGDPERAESLFRNAVERSSENLQNLYALERFLGEKDGESAVEESRNLTDRLLAIDPDNLAASIEKLRLEIRAGDLGAANQTADTLFTRLADWPEAVAAPLSGVRRHLHENNGDRAASELDGLAIVLERFPEFRADERALSVEPSLAAESMTSFLRMENPQPGAAPADLELAFARQTVELSPEAWRWVGVPILRDDGIPVLVSASDSVLHIDPEDQIALPRTTGASDASVHLVAPLDFDYDFRVDLAVAGKAGFRLYRLAESGHYEDVSGSLSLSPFVLNRAYEAVWALDVDIDGDMDLVLAPTGAAPVTLQNGGDGSFAAVEKFAASRDVRDLTWLDADGDDDADLFFLTREGLLDFYRNEGAGVYTKEAIPASVPPLDAFVSTDIDYDGDMDLLGLTGGARVVRLSPQKSRFAWPVVTVAHFGFSGSGADDGSGVDVVAGPWPSRLGAGDLDNNGSLDLVASARGSTHILLSNPDGTWTPLDDISDFRLFEIMDLVGVGRLDLVGLDSSGRVVQMMNMAQNPYRSRTLRMRTADSVGDRRINSYGIGGHVELTAGLHVQNRPITGPVVHFGLGTEHLVDAVRVVWPNGVVQPLYDLESDQAILAREGLNASCPWLYARSENGVRFVEDFMMRSPLGFRLGESETMPLGLPEDRIRIDRRDLAARNGSYELRLTAELWEAVYVDRLSLIAIDHPAGTEFFLNEVFSDPPPSLEPVPMGTPRLPAGARDGHGRDVLELVETRDERYVADFALGPLMGQAEEHTLEIDLDTAGASTGWLVLEGWLRPGNSTLSLAASQSRRTAAALLELEYLDASGNWRTSPTNLGLPYGKRKSLLVDLARAVPVAGVETVRIRSNLEIYWDRVFLADRRDEAALTTRRLDLESSELRFRGFSEVNAPERWTPELPDYERVVSRRPVWVNPEGYYTRHGVVDELLAAADDRYVIMSAGDEIVVHFSDPGPPQRGWVRDFVLVGAGWTKDGSIATLHSNTVLPLPSRETVYPWAALPLESDPMYLRYPEDWRTYHTRFVSRDMPRLAGVRTARAD